MIQKLLCILMMLFTGHKIHAQVYGNEWINYTQPYFKFGVFRDDIYRIQVSQLQGIGLPASVNGSDLQLFRDGQEVRIYVSTNGLLSATDFVEFYGERANGKVDQPLYKNPSEQLNPHQNLLTDTAYYFLTVNTSSGHLRFTERPNNLSAPPAKEPYFWDVTKTNFRTDFVSGTSYYYATTPIIYLCSSQYEEGEGYTRKLTNANDSVTYQCLFPFKQSGAPNATYKTTIAGYSYITEHRVKLLANNTELADSTFGAFAGKRYQLSVPMNLLGSNNRFVFRYTPMNNKPAENIVDRYGISYAELRYPREFNFNNTDSLYFELDPKPSDYYLEISNFKHNGVAPRLYDLESGEYLVGDLSVAGLVRYLIPASAQIKRLFIQSQAGAASIGSVSDLRPVTFKNYTQSANQGDYILISHPRLFDDGSGVNYVEQYRSYRSSSAGGGFNAVTVDVQDIYNEFGFGYTYHPQSIKNFLHYAADFWTQKPKNLLILGKGINYRDYQNYSKASSATYPYPVVPSFGEPCSDALLSDFNFSSKASIPTGRLTVWNGDDVRKYLEKIKDHEAMQANTSQQISDSILWRKNVLHIAGAKKAEEQAPIVASLTGHENRIKDSLFGARVTTIKKSSATTVESANSALVDQLFNGGLSLVQFFGHASSSTLDYNLDNPELMRNYRRYPVFIANGCGVGNVYILAVGERTLGEKFVLSPIGGSIAFIASNNTGLSNILGWYTDSLYRRFSLTAYGKSIGEQMQQNVSSLNLATNGLLRQHAEQIMLNGDPAVAMFHFQQPDYAVEEKGVIFKQLNLTTSLDSFDVDLVLYNLGRYLKDSFSVVVKRILPDGSETELLAKFHPSMATTDTLHLRIPTEGNRAIGDNALDIILDQEGFVQEISEMNNQLRKVFSVFNEDLVPVYPYNFGIVGTQNVTLKASTLNPFAPERAYRLQMDTTELFNSPLLRNTVITSKGGVIRWQPSITLQDSTVYYWRTAMDTSSSNPKLKWSNSSFVFLNGSQAGWNQSHFFQYRYNQYADMVLDSLSRRFNFLGVGKKLLVQNVCLYGPSPYQYKWNDYRVKLNGSKLFDDGCDPFPGYSSLQFIVLDSLTGEPWRNAVVGSEGRFGSFKPCRTSDLSDPFFEFGFTNQNARKKIMDFIDSIPTGYYVLVQPRLCVGATCAPLNSIFVHHWKADTTLFGSGNSMYHKLLGLGFTQIDSFTKNRPMAFFARKGYPSTAEQVVEQDSTKVLVKEFSFSTYLFQGTVHTGKIGPASQWDRFLRKGFTSDPGAGDTVEVDIYGIDLLEQETLLGSTKGDTLLQTINATQYPYLRLVMRNRDNSYTTPEQIRYWRVLYQPEPELAINPNRHWVYADSASQGQITRLEVALENVSDYPMDSVLVKYQVIDPQKNRKPLTGKRYRALPANDTLHAVIDIPTLAWPGQNILAIEANPDWDQPEQYHPNNLGYLNWFVQADQQNPLLDVTFDGVHIMDRDIVSAKPLIQIQIRDENKFMAIDDTNLVDVKIRYPGDDPTLFREIPFDGQTLRFYPADLGNGKTQNRARIEYRPTFETDGGYVLQVTAKDRAGNISGNNSYKVGFEVLNKASISSVVNYPNPFSTSTQFVFTITGYEIPSQLKIQIISPSGRVVREITRAELGPLHIGTNVTEFRWKGDDQFGQPLGNGVYLYRVVSSLHGEKLDHYQKSASQNADRWIEKGFGKLYIMR